MQRHVFLYERGVVLCKRVGKELDKATYQFKHLLKVVTFYDQQLFQFAHSTTLLVSIVIKKKHLPTYIHLAAGWKIELVVLRNGGSWFHFSRFSQNQKAISSWGRMWTN